MSTSTKTPMVADLVGKIKANQISVISISFGLLSVAISLFQRFLPTAALHFHIAPLSQTALTHLDVLNLLVAPFIQPNTATLIMSMGLVALIGVYVEPHHKNKRQFLAKAVCSALLGVVVQLFLVSASACGITGFIGFFVGEAFTKRFDGAKEVAGIFICYLVLLLFCAPIGYIVAGVVGLLVGIVMQGARGRLKTCQ